jgi:hypothetical protein
MDPRMTRVKALYLLAIRLWRERLWPQFRRPWLAIPLCLLLILC